MAERAEVGRALALLGDGEWGGAVTADRAAGHYRDELVGALVGWCGTGHPSRRRRGSRASRRCGHPELVPSLAERLARELGLPFRPVVRKTRETAPQAEMRNGPRSSRPTWTARSRSTARCSDGPVLLVDDLVDSRGGR